MPPDPVKPSVLFVCMGNICRSPMAHGIFEHLVLARGMGSRFDIDSCGTGSWHVGNDADPRTRATLAVRGIPLAHTARQFDASTDLARFTHILAMDQANLRALSSLGCPADRVQLLRIFDPALAGKTVQISDLEVPDPYYGGEDGFERVFEMVHAACQGLLNQLV